MKKEAIRKIVGEKDNKILQLEKQIERLKKSIRDESERYGLAWIEVPEAFEDDVENKLPIVEAAPKLDIKNKDDKPTHLLIEADNYHALTCLNYTHKGKIDVIYIDPPYNTGSDGFRYKDKRILDKYPDGTEVPTDHPLRHSYWLSFMRKRLELARELLSDEGVLFASIDDNEVAQLKLLLDNYIFDEAYQKTIIIWQKKVRPSNKNKDGFSSTTEYILMYSKSQKNIALIPVDLNAEYVKKIYKNPDNDMRGPWRGQPLWSESNTNKRKELILPDGRKITQKWFVSQQGLNKLYQEKRIIESRNGVLNAKSFLGERTGKDPMNLLTAEDVGTTEEATKELKEILGSKESSFMYPKPLRLIKYLLSRVPNNQNAKVLDFFAGSGTTGHAVMQLNQEDGGTRQFILITDNEGKIMSKVCRPRIKKAIKGYGKVAGLGGSLKYYRIGFVGQHNILNTDDKDKLTLAHNAGELLAIAENTLEEIEKNDYFHVFRNKDHYTAVYFRENFDKFDAFIARVLKLSMPVVVYIFSWENDPFIEDFEGYKDITVKTIPEPILEIYRNIYNL